MDGSHACTILIVEDTEVNIDIMVEALGAHFELIVATDGETALELARKDLPDLILLDIMLPGLNGFEVCERIKQDPRTEDIPVLFVSALSDGVDKLRGFEVGGADYIIKPFDPSELLARAKANARPRRKKVTHAAPTVWALNSEELSGLVSNEPLRIGSDFGSFHIVKLLGQGGMGEVYEAERLSDKEHVALKVMSHLFPSRSEQMRFLREGEITASVDHPNCVKVTAVDWVYGRPVVVMELLEGGTLKDELIERGLFECSTAVDAMLQVVEGLHAAHKLGILHRDIKPANCFLDAIGGVKIGDFGLAKRQSSEQEPQLTVEGTYLGTPAYSSPEQLSHDVLDVRADIYSVGATLFHLLTGHVPFEAESNAKMMALILNGHVPSAKLLRKSIPDALNQIILKCLKADKEDRYADYNALSVALRSI
jgi:serine/threonine protein kinase